MTEFDSVIVKNTPAQILSSASSGGQQTVSEVGDDVDSPLPYVGKLLKKLEKEGLVESRTSEEDGREKVYEVTEEGQVLIELLEGIYSEA